MNRLHLLVPVVVITLLLTLPGVVWAQTVPPAVFLGTASVDGEFSNLIVAGPGSPVTSTIANNRATQELPREMGELTLVDLRATNSGTLPAIDLEPLGDRLVRVFNFSNTTKTWSFYDPREAFSQANTLSTLVSGEVYWVKVTETATVRLNDKFVTLTCIQGNCWNQIVW